MAKLEKNLQVPQVDLKFLDMSTNDIEGIFVDHLDQWTHLLSNSIRREWPWPMAGAGIPIFHGNVHGKTCENHDNPLEFGVHHFRQKKLYPNFVLTWHFLVASNPIFFVGVPHLNRSRLPPNSIHPKVSPLPA